MNNLDKQYVALLQDILDNGVVKQDRTGTGTLSLFGKQIRHKMSEGFPLLTTKKLHWKSIVGELIWFLRGDTNIKWLVDNQINIWNGDAFKKYNTTYKGNFPMDMEEFVQAIKTSDEFAETYGELGPIYGKQWRNLERYEIYKRLFKYEDGTAIFSYVKDKSIDQITNLINDLKTNPDSRRLMVNAWNVGELGQMTLPPCHFSFQCYSHEKDGKRYLSLAWNQRSIDFGLGLPFNIASYGLLLEIIAKEVNMIPYELIGNLGDCHIYNNHIDSIKEQLIREPFYLPQLKIKTKDMGGDCLPSYSIDDFIIENYRSHPTIKLPLSN